jgi:hypothetical protein
VFVCIYNSNNTNESISQISNAVKNVASWFNCECKAPNLIIGCYDRGTFDIPEVTAEKQQKIEIATKGEPYFLFFPMNSDKKSIRYNSVLDYSAIKLFLEQKSEAVI